jgi:hypothetical protein
VAPGVEKARPFPPRSALSIRSPACQFRTVRLAHAEHLAELDSHRLRAGVGPTNNLADASSVESLVTLVALESL